MADAEHRPDQRHAGALLAKAEIGPGAFLIAVDEFDLGQELQVPRNAGLRLSENFGKISDGEIPSGKQREKAHAGRLTRSLQHIHQRVETKLSLIRHIIPHQHIKICLCDLRM